MLSRRESFKVGMCWAVHHDLELEWCHDYQARAGYIHWGKPEWERATRIQYFQPVRGVLPAEVIESALAMSQDWTHQPWDVCSQASTAYRAVLAKFQPEITALHQIEQPDSPWNGTELVMPKEIEDECR